MYYTMAKEVLTVRDVDEEVWKKFRAKTEEEGMRTGAALNQALDYWIKEKERKKIHPNPRRFLKVEGLVRTGRRVEWSEEIDKVLYGDES